MKTSYKEMVNDSKTLFRNLDLKMTYFESKAFEHRLKKNYNKSENLYYGIMNSLNSKHAQYFENKAAEENIINSLKEGKNLVHILCTDPVTKQLCFGLMGRIVDFSKEVDDHYGYGPFFGKKIIKLLRK